MIVVIDLLKNKTISTSSLSTIEIETQNALNSGFLIDNIQVLDITEEEYQVILNNRPQPPIIKSELELLKDQITLLIKQANATDVRMGDTENSINMVFAIL